MKSLFSRQLSTSLLLAATMTATSAAQADTFKYPEIKDDRYGGFTITPVVGQFNFDADRSLDDETFTGIGLGYRFSNPYMLEFIYGTADANTTAGVSQGDIKQYRLEMLYDTGDFGNFSPYIAVGAANTEFGSNATTTDDEGAMTLGFGARYSFTDRIALRGDARYLKGVGDSKASDVLLGVGLQFFLGKTSAAPIAEPVAVAEPQSPSLNELCAQAGGVLKGEECLKTSIFNDRVNLNVQFELNSDQIQTSYVSEVAGLAEFMNTYPTANVVIEGHTDALGSDTYNQELSQRRVNEVTRMLSENYGIAQSRVSAIGYGEAQPIASNDTAADRAKNRRVVASITAEIEEVIVLDVK